MCGHDEIHFLLLMFLSNIQIQYFLYGFLLNSMLNSFGKTVAIVSGYKSRSPGFDSRRCPQRLAVTLPTSGGHSVSIVHLRTKAMEFIFV
jgi:hypothetical protein